MMILGLNRDLDAKMDEILELKMRSRSTSARKRSGYASITSANLTSQQFERAVEQETSFEVVQKQNYELMARIGELESQI